LQFGDSDIAAFATAARAELLTPASPHAKAFLKAIVEKVVVGPAGVELAGTKAQLAVAVSRWNPGTAPGAVPSTSMGQDSGIKHSLAGNPSFAYRGFDPVSSQL
jgi:hypothetical protein